MFSGDIKFIKLTKHETKFNVLVNLNDIVFVDDKVVYREVWVKLPDKTVDLIVDDEIDTIYDMIETHKSQQPICD